MYSASEEGGRPVRSLARRAEEEEEDRCKFFFPVTVFENRGDIDDVMSHFFLKTF